MPWYAVVYSVLLVGFGVYSAYDDLRLRQSVGYVLMDAGVTLIWVYFVAAYFYPALAPVGFGPLLLLVFAIVWSVIDVRRELRALVRDRPSSYDPELSPRTNLWIDRGVEAFGLLVGTGIVVPALIAGVVVAARGW
jgi:hypothetical protein